MAIKVIAQRRVLKIGKNPGVKSDEIGLASMDVSPVFHWMVYLILWVVFVDLTVRMMRYIFFPHIPWSNGSSWLLMSSTDADSWFVS